MYENKSMLDLNIKKITLKTVLIGETSVGKTSIINRFIHNQFYQNFGPTMSGTCATKEIYYEQYNKILKYEIWDTAGQERYRALTKMIYKDASIVILVFDITRKDTFEEIRDFWINQVKLFLLLEIKKIIMNMKILIIIVLKNLLIKLIVFIKELVLKVVLELIIYFMILD